MTIAGTLLSLDDAIEASAAFSPALRICLGIEVATRQPFWLPEDAFLRGVHVRGPIGAGKTSLIRQILVSRGVEAPFVNFDYIGTGHRELQAWIAYTATMYAIAEDACPELAGITASFLRRFAFVAVGAPNPPVRFDLLRRRTLPGGRVEPLRAVVSRAVEVLFVKLNDAEAAQRVRFLRIATALLTVLAAAERSIAEGLTFLDVPEFISFLDREIESRTFRSTDLPFLQHQRMELDHILRLRPSDPSKSWRAFQDETASTRNSLSDFAIGTVLGDLFNDETLPLEDVAFGGTSLSITNREPEDLQKTKAYQAIHAMLHALFLHRQDLPDLSWLLVITDEPQWMGRNLERVLAVSRNLKVSYVVSHQCDAQWPAIGLPTMAQQLPSLTNLQISFRPTTFEEAENEVLHTTTIEPDGLVQRFWTSSYGESDVSGSTVQQSWANALRFSEYQEFAGSGETRGSSEGRTSSSGTSLGEHETVNVVGFSDQVKVRAQAALRRASFRGVVTDEGEGTEVAFVPAPTFPHVFM
ncbi:MAG TPA: hypothetical protein VFO89_05470, partial [Thermoanaerobaculia bacterium]|nr:hypothetical protein [Thermoanaerobaculia bacterium]